MPGRVRRRRSATRSFRPQTDWAAVTGYGTLVAGVPGTDNDFINLSVIEGDAPLLPLGESYTLMRTRGVWHAYPVVWPNATPGIIDVAVGIGVAPVQAITAGALPDPIENSEWDGWLMRRWTYFRLPGQSNATTTPAALAGAVGQGGGFDNVWSLDSRAMRRLEDNDLFLAMSLGTDTGEAVQVNYIFDLRQLFQQSAKR